MANINEVAKAAGVSISTVSYALSGKRAVSPDTRRRIEKAVQDLNYLPNAGARMLAGRRTQIFALTEPLRKDTHAPTHMAFVLAASVAARRHDYDVLLLTEEEAQQGMRRVAANRLVDAILVLDVAPDDPRVGLARSIASPTVFIGVPRDHAGLICVDLDFEAAAARAVDLLADAGHTSIGLVGQAEAAYEKSNFPPRVREAFLRRAEERDVEAVHGTSGGARASRTAARRTVADMISLGATALVLHTAEEAHGSILAELSERGLRVPEDISVVSVGASFDTATLETPIDSFPLDPQASCDAAVDLALAAVDGHPEPAVHLIAPRYHAHGSIGPRHERAVA